MLIFNSGINDVAVEYAVVFAERVHVFVHILVPLVRRHAVQNVPVKGLFGLLIPQLEIFDCHA